MDWENKLSHLLMCLLFLFIFVTIHSLIDVKENKQLLIYLKPR